MSACLQVNSLNRRAGQLLEQQLALEEAAASKWAAVAANSKSEKIVNIFDLYIYDVYIYIVNIH